jgi:hypothetical protein
VSRVARAAVAAVALVPLACKKAPAPAPGAPAPAIASQADPRPKRLPEDPVKGAKSTAQWQEHLREEEEERRLAYDQSREKEHEAVLAALEKARDRIDSAKTKAELNVAAAAVKASLPALRKKVDAIDPKRQSSNLLTDYEAILELLAGPYVTARSAAIEGDGQGSGQLRADIERRLAKARAWLEKESEEAERSKRRRAGQPEAAR